MIATTTNAAISKSARSNDFDRGFAISASNGGIYTPSFNSLIRCQSPETAKGRSVMM
jgi:hypothetical protein